MTEKKKWVVTPFNTIMAILLVVVLFMPIASAWGSQYYKSYVILTSDESHFNQIGYINGHDQFNITTANTLMPVLLRDYDEASNDTLIWDNTDHNALLNAVTVAGNTNIVTVNYSKVGGSIIDGIYIELDMTSHELADLDFIRVNSTDKHTGGHEISTVYNDYPMATIDNNSYLLVIDLITKTDLLTNPDTEINLFYDSNIDETDSTWEFQIRQYRLSETVWAIGDFVGSAMSQMAGVCILGFAIFLNSDPFDLKIDRKKK